MFAVKITNHQSELLETSFKLEPGKAGAFYWLHFEGEMSDAAKWLNDNFQVDPICIEALCDELTRPRIFIGPNEELVTTFRSPVGNIDTDFDYVSIRSWVTSDFIVTVAREDIPLLRGVRDKLLKQTKDIGSPLQLLWRICDITTEKFTDHIVNIDEKITDFEDEWEANSFIKKDNLHLVRQKMSRIRRFLIPQLEAFQKLAYSIDTSIVPKRDIKRIKSQWLETVNMLLRNNEVLNENQDRIIILQDMLFQQKTEATNNIMYLLSIVATFFLPITFFTSLLGINVSGMPSADSPWAFSFVCLVLFLIMVIQWLLFRRWKWFKLS